MPGGFLKGIAPEGRERREDAVVDEDLHHRHRHVCRTAEREVPVQREVPYNRADQGYEIARPVVPSQHSCKCIMKECEHTCLYQTGAHAEQRELYCLKYHVFPVVCVLFRHAFNNTSVVPSAQA